MHILVLFGGAGIATRGLLDSGHQCTCVEIDSRMTELSQSLNPTANHLTCDVRDLDAAWIASFEAVWASPPCQGWSDQNHGTADVSGMDLLPWSLALPNEVLWVENVISGQRAIRRETLYNAAQFEQIPRQRRRRIIEGRYKKPAVYRGYKPDYPEYFHCACPAVLASEMKQGGKSRSWKNERRCATRWHEHVLGRSITLEDMAYRQGFTIPPEWYQYPKYLLSRAIGNGVPVYMSKAFGDAYTNPTKILPQQLEFANFGEPL